MSNCAGVALIKNRRLEYQVIALEYIPNKFISIEAICLTQYNREATFALTTKNISAGEMKTSIALSIINSLIKEIGLDSEKLRKLCIRDKQIFFIVEV